MDPDSLLAIAIAALAAAVIVNAGNGAPPEGVIAQAREYEAHLGGIVTRWESAPDLGTGRA